MADTLVGIVRLAHIAPHGQNGGQLVASVLRFHLDQTKTQSRILSMAFFDEEELALIVERRGRQLEVARDRRMPTETFFAGPRCSSTGHRQVSGLETDKRDRAAGRGTRSGRSRSRALMAK